MYCSQMRKIECRRYVKGGPSRHRGNANRACRYGQTKCLKYASSSGNPGDWAGLGRIVVAQQPRSVRFEQKTGIAVLKQSLQLPIEFELKSSTFAVRCCLNRSLSLARPVEISRKLEYF